MALMLADMRAGGHIDPAYEAHTGPIVMWAKAVWNNWLPAEGMRAAVLQALQGIKKNGTTSWHRVTGPAAAMVASAWHASVGS